MRLLMRFVVSTQTFWYTVCLLLSKIKCKWVPLTSFQLNGCNTFFFSFELKTRGSMETISHARHVWVKLIQCNKNICVKGNCVFLIMSVEHSKLCFPICFKIIKMSRLTIPSTLYLFWAIVLLIFFSKFKSIHYSFQYKGPKHQKW